MENGALCMCVVWLRGALCDALCDAPVSQSGRDAETRARGPKDPWGERAPAARRGDLGDETQKKHSRKEKKGTADR